MDSYCDALVRVTMRAIAVVASRSSSCLRRLLLLLECDERDDGDCGDVRHTVVVVVVVD